MSYSAELIVHVIADDPDEALRLRMKVEALLLVGTQNFPKSGKVRWLCSRPVSKVIDQPQSKG